MKGNEKPSKLVQYGGVLSFILLSLLALYWFIIKSVSLAGQVVSSPAVVVFDKGALYMLGVAIGSGALVT